MEKPAPRPVDSVAGMEHIDRDSRADLRVTGERGYCRPTRFRVHVLDPLARFMIRRGLAPGSQDGSGLRVLEVRGRRTGRRYQRPVAVATVDGQRHIVSLWGESEWARNLRAGTGADAALRIGRRTEPI